MGCCNCAYLSIRGPLLYWRGRKRENRLLIVGLESAQVIFARFIFSYVRWLRNKNFKISQNRKNFDEFFFNSVKFAHLNQQNFAHSFEKLKANFAKILKLLSIFQIFFSMQFLSHDDVIDKNTDITFWKLEGMNCDEFRNILRNKISKFGRNFRNIDKKN